MNNLQIERSLVIGWCVASLSLNVASVRYRAILPITALEALGHTCHLFTNADPVNLKLLDVLVIVKDFSVESYRLAQRAKSLKIPVIFDLCDNIFVKGYGKYSAHAPSEMFMALTKYADAIVVTTLPLAEVIGRHVTDVQIDVIPDGIICAQTSAALDARLISACARVRTPTAFGKKMNRLKHLSRLLGGASLGALIKKRTARLRSLIKRLVTRWRSLFSLSFWKRRADRLLSRIKTRVDMAAVRRQTTATQPPAEVGAPPAPNALRLLWFGNHGAEYADFGMLDLLRVQKELEAIALEYNVELVVVSNNRGKYSTYLRPMAIASRYVEWSPTSIERELQRATLVLIPNSLDDFSICKSANRSVHALTSNLPVVATSTPSILPLAGGVWLDDFATGIRRYLSSAQNAAEDVAKGRELAQAHFGSSVISELWLKTLKRAIAKARVEKPVPEVIFVVNLIQDLDVILPIIAEAQRRAIPYEVWSSSALLKKHPRVLRILEDVNVQATVVLESEVTQTPLFASGTKALLTVTETNLAPHVFTRTLTQRANKSGLTTATLQHGFENVGLTYSDEVHHIRKVKFAAQKIFLWGPLDTLHPSVKSATRAKCIPAGCPKPVTAPPADLNHMIDRSARVIGIFENLHWHRYDDAYRAFFIDGVMALAEQFPQIVFLLKPHQAGLWLTKRYKGGQPVAPNLLIVDPESPEWQKFTADQLLSRMEAVITSPSTIALDAARKGLSVAVVGHELQLDHYAPLPRIITIEDWTAFVASTLAHTGLDKRSTDFVRRTVIEGPAASKILDSLII